MIKITKEEIEEIAKLNKEVYKIELRLKEIKKFFEEKQNEK